MKAKLLKMKIKTTHKGEVKLVVWTPSLTTTPRLLHWICSDHFALTKESHYHTHNGSLQFAVTPTKHRINSYFLHFNLQREWNKANNMIRWKKKKINIAWSEKKIQLIQHLCYYLLFTWIVFYSHCWCCRR